MSTKALIIGYGNVDRQDDGVAWYVLAEIAKQLGETRSLDPEVDHEIDTDVADLRFMLQLTPELAESIAAYSKVGFIDACVSPLQDHIALTHLEAKFQSSPMTHHMTPETILSICQTLYQQTPDAVLLSVEAREFGFSRNLSAHTQALVKKAATQVMEWLCPTG